MAFKLSNAQVFYRDENEANGLRTIGLRDGDTTVFTTIWPTTRDKQANPLHDSAWAELQQGKTCDATVSYYRVTKGKGSDKRVFHNFNLVDFEKVS